MWLSGLSADLQTKGSPVWFPVRAHAWVSDQDPSRGLNKKQPHIDVSLPLFLPPFPSLKQTNKQTNKSIFKENSGISAAKSWYTVQT